MSYTYADKKRRDTAAQNTEVSSQPSLDELRAGTAAPSREQLGHRVDLPEAMREKMENAFGTDLSAVKLYESETVGEAGAEAVTQGSNIAFAPGMLDFSSYEGQTRLGHELSHVVSQARGEVTGDGLLNDHSLEARAEREGAMAAAGQQISVPTEAMSHVTSAQASGPMQCRGKRESNKVIDNLHRIGSGMAAGADISDEDQQFYSDNVKSLSPKERKMIGKRARKNMRDQYSLYSSLTKGGKSRIDAGRQVLSGQAYNDSLVYSGMINAYASSNGLTGSQTDEEFAGMRSLLSGSDRKKAALLDDEIYDDSDIMSGDEWDAMDAARKRQMADYYRKRK